MHSGRIWFLGILAAGGLSLALTHNLSRAQATAQPAPVRIGTYSTRAVALAYGRSEENLRKIDKEYNEGQELKRKDPKKFEKIKAEMRERQAREHAQVFSNAPIDDIMATIKDALPGIAQKAGVSAIVPEVDYHDPAVEVVDVTDALVEHFKPTDKTRVFIKDLLKHPPVSYKELAEHKH